MTKDEWYDNLTINDTLKMHAPDQQNFIDIKTVWVTVPTAAPILKISQGMWGMKDFSCLGFLGSVSKTTITLGETYTNCIPTDIGKMVKDDGGDTSVLANYDNENKKWYLAGSASVVSGSSMTIVNGTGAGISSGNSTTGGGGAILMGHGLNDASEPPKITLMDSASGFDTLYLKKFGGSDPAHLDIGTISIHGHLGVGDTVTSDLNPNPNLHLGNSNNPWEWIDTLYVFTNTINVLSQSYTGMPPILPNDSDYANGNWANPWGYVTGETLYYKYLSTYYCAKELSGTPVERKIKTIEDAVASLKHEVTKDLLHISYGEKEGTIKCTCGKEATEPCPEHFDEWRDKYTVNTGDVIDSTALIVLNLLERIESLGKNGVTA